jgi:hypothetical protein
MGLAADGVSKPQTIRLRESTQCVETRPLRAVWPRLLFAQCDRRWPCGPLQLRLPDTAAVASARTSTLWNSRPRCLSARPGQSPASGDDEGSRRTGGSAPLVAETRAGEPASRVAAMPRRRPFPAPPVATAPG